jgi:hypothetical protein
MKPEDILRKGAVEVHAKVGGIRQLHVLKVTYEKSAWGMVPYLVSKHKLPTAELLRLAEELQLPIKCHGVTAFPKGKAAQDFAKKEEEPEEEEEREKEEGEEKSGKREKEEKAEEKNKKEEKKARKKMLSHDVIIKGGEEGEEAVDEGAEEASAASEKESKESEEPQAAPAEPAEEESQSAAAPFMPIAVPAQSQEQSIEIELVPQPDAKKGAQGQKDASPKDKKRLFDESVLSEGILR